MIEFDYFYYIAFIHLPFLIVNYSMFNVETLDWYATSLTYLLHDIYLLKMIKFTFAYFYKISSLSLSFSNHF